MGIGIVCAGLSIRRGGTRSGACVWMRSPRDQVLTQKAHDKSWAHLGPFGGVSLTYIVEVFVVPWAMGRWLGHPLKDIGAAALPQVLLVGGELLHGGGAHGQS